MKKIVMVNVGFKDAYTGEEYEAGKPIVLSEQRVAEVKEIDKNLISVIGNAEETPNETEVALAASEEKLEAANAELEAANAELETAKAEVKAANDEIKKLKKELEKATKPADK